MKRVIATILIAIVMITIATNFASAQMTDYTHRAQFQNKSLLQLGYFPSVELNDDWSIKGIGLVKQRISWLKTGIRVVELTTELSLGPKWFNGSLSVWPLIGVLFATESNRSIYTRLSLHGKYDSDLVEINTENMFDFAAKHDPILDPNGTFQRLSIQYGDKEYWHFRIGVQGEILTAENKQPLIMAGPMLSFFWPGEKYDARLDFYAGPVINDNRPQGGTPTTYRIWWWITPLKGQ